MENILFGQMKEAEEDAKLTESTNNQDMKSKIQVRFPLYRKTQKQNSINSDQKVKFLMPVTENLSSSNRSH